MKNLIFLIPIALILVSCGEGSQELPDIEATVEARVGLVKASLTAPTLIPLSTYTPLPTYTPAPLPSPEVVIKEVVVEKVIEVPVTKVVEVIKTALVRLYLSITIDFPGLFF